MITPALKERMCNELANGMSPIRSNINVYVPVRRPVEDVQTFVKANVTIPTSTEYSFSSKDGYAISYLDSMWFWQRPKSGYPDLTRGLIELQDGIDGQAGLHDNQRFAKDPNFKPVAACLISRSACFGSTSTNESASTFFKRIAFERPKCGDCIVTALIGASGVAGINKFLPEPSVPLPSDVSSDTPIIPPHLPLTSEWQTTDFSLARSMPKGSGTVNMTLRAWCARLIQRYSYVLGSTSSDMYQMKTASEVEAKLEDLKHEVQNDLETNYVSRSADAQGQQSWRQSATNVRSLSKLKDKWMHKMGEGRGPLAFLCLNDDVMETGELRSRLDQSLSSFLSSMWPNKMSFESKA